MMKVLLALLGLITAAGTMAAAEPVRPNILFILADDLGWADLGCCSPESKVPTPNLDKLASAGLRFTQAYCPVSVCSPTRYGLMTGRYPWRSWKKRGVLANWERPMIEPQVRTLPAMLRSAGYTTAGFGKWHLGANYSTTDGRPPSGLGQFKSKGTGSNIDLAAPIAEGPLDRGFEHWFGFICASEMLIFDGNRAVSLLSHSLYEPPAVPGIGRLSGVTVAEFLPLITHRSSAWLRDHAAVGKGKPFFLYYAPYVPHVPLAAGGAFLGKTRAGEYGDYVHQLDHEIGRLLSVLEEAGVAQDTLVIFASDNGSQFQSTGAGHRPHAGLRGTKGQIYEGGVRTPLIVRWPGRVAAGAVNDDVVALTDWMATLAALTGQPDGSGDSRNILPLLLGEKPVKPIRPELIVQSARGQFALRRGPWKFVRAPGTGPGGELYDLVADPGEKHDLHAQKPELAAELRSRLQTLLEETSPLR